MDHPRAAMRITVLAMFALYLSSPRLKEYAFFELALYAAILVVDLPALALAALPRRRSRLSGLVSTSGRAFEGSFILLIIALIGFWILLLDFRAEPKRLETEARSHNASIVCRPPLGAPVSSDGAGSRGRTGTALARRGILSPLRLPIPPCPLDPTRSTT